MYVYIIGEQVLEDVISDFLDLQDDDEDEDSEEEEDAA
jgi:hypothetical protein